MIFLNDNMSEQEKREYSARNIVSATVIFDHEPNDTNKETILATFQTAKKYGLSSDECIAIFETTFNNGRESGIQFINQLMRA